ncbi:MAG TPA: HEAT repeat domain-containing protein [Polyangiaceae bacterium]
MSDAASLLPGPEGQAEAMARVAELRARGVAGVQGLVALLAQPAWTVRRAVVAALAEAEPAAVALLCEALRTSRDNESKLAGIVDALSQTKNEVSDPLLALMFDANVAVVCDAVQILGRRECAVAVPRLIELTSHADDNVALAAVEALGRIGGSEALESLLALATSGNFFRTFPVIDVLGRSRDPRVLPTLLKLAADPVYGTEAVRALGRLGDPAAVSALVDQLSRAGENVVRAIALALVTIRDGMEQRFGTAVALERALLASPRLSEVRRQLTLGLKRADPSERVALSKLLGCLSEENTVPTLLALLDGPADTAQVAASALRKLGALAEPMLVEALRSGSSVQRRLLVPILSGRLAARDELIAALHDDDPEVRALACDALAKTSDASASPAIFPLLGDADARVGQAALGAIQSLGSDETTRLALEAAESSDVRVRRAGLRIIGYFGLKQGLEALIAGTKADDERVREAALAGLPFMDDARALALLVAAAQSPSTRTRVSALRALAHCTAEDGVRAQLRASLGDSDAWARYYACRALGKLGDDEATDAVAALLADGSGQVRVAAVDALAHLRGPRAFEILRGVLGSKDSDLHRAAVLALGISRRREALAPLLSALSAGDASTRLVAVSALSELGLEDALPAIARAALDPDEGVRVAAAGFLATRTDAGATDQLLAILAKDPSRQSVIHALARPVGGRVEAIAAALETADDALAGALITSLVRTQSDAAVHAIRVSLASRNEAARRAAASALIAIQDSASARDLERAALHDPDAEVRRICAASNVSP